MAGLFEGTPTTTTATSSTSTATPSWLQDAIYKQIQLTGGVTATPYKPYSGSLVAGLSPLQQQAQQGAQTAQGAWQQPYQQAVSGVQNAANTGSGALSAAQPYLNRAGATTASSIQGFMNPYNQNVTDEIARLGARNLSENLLPAVGDQFIQAGQFGGTRMGEFGARALRDTQDSILGQQANALQSGYGQALGAAQTDASRNAALAGTVGGLQGGDYSSRLSALGQLSGLAGQGQDLRYGDLNQLNQFGTQQQANTQQGLDANYAQYLRELQYPQQQLQFGTSQLQGLAPMINSTQTQTNSSTGNTGLSPLSQIGALGSLAGGLFSGTGANSSGPSIVSQVGSGLSGLASDAWNSDFLSGGGSDGVGNWGTLGDTLSGWFS